MIRRDWIGREGQAARMLGLLSRLIAEILELAIVVRDCLWVLSEPLRTAGWEPGERESSQLCGQWSMVKTHQGQGGGGQWGFRIWGRQLKSFCARDAVLWGYMPLDELIEKQGVVSQWYGVMCGVCMCWRGGAGREQGAASEFRFRVGNWEK